MHTIEVIGLGLTEDTLTVGAMRKLRAAECLILHTERIGAADWLKAQGIAFASLDELYETVEDFDEHAEQAADAVLDAAEEHDVVYGVIDVRDESVARLLNEASDSVRITAGVPVDGALNAFCTDQTVSVCASDYESMEPRSDIAMLVREIDSAQMASEVKLKLMESYPDDSPAWVLNGGMLSRIALEDLDRLTGYDHRFCALILPCTDLMAKQRYDFSDLMRVVRRLHARNGCPWDRAQTHESFKPLLIEEAYEVADAIDADDPFALADELGDVLFEVASHAVIGEKTADFDMTDITTAICQKMIHRHPKIFPPKDGKTAVSWDQFKLEEKQLTSFADLLRQVSRSLPATLRAMKIRRRLGEAGLPAEEYAVIWQRLEDALCRMKEAPSEQVLGEALYALCGLAAGMKLNPELALNGISDEMTEQLARAEAGTDWKQLTSEEKRARWDESARTDR